MGTLVFSSIVPLKAWGSPKKVGIVYLRYQDEICLTMFVLLKISKCSKNSDFSPDENYIFAELYKYIVEVWF